MKTFLILGATGATGKLLCAELLSRGFGVRAVVRSVSRLPESLKNDTDFSCIEGNILEMSENELSEALSGISGVASCLGHNITWKGIYGKPRRLVRDSVIKVCYAAKKLDQHVRFVLMNTTGNKNRDLDEQVPLPQKIVVGILRYILPPHADNEEAADFLRTSIGQHDACIQWTAVRPDGLIDNPEVTEYVIHPSPLRDVIMNPGKTSRINVAHFMASLLTGNTLWDTWKGRMPVIYNSNSL